MNMPLNGVGPASRRSQFTRPVLATIYLLDETGICSKKWLVQDNRISIGSHRDCSVQIFGNNVEPVHAVLTFGRRHIVLKAFADDVVINDRVVREWLFEHACDIQIASQTLRVVPQRDLVKKTTDQEPSKARPAEVASGFSNPTVASDLPAIKQLLETLILPLRQGLEDVKQQIIRTSPADKNHDAVRVPADEQEPNRLLDEIDHRIRSILAQQDEHLSATLSEIQNNLREKKNAPSKLEPAPNLEMLTSFRESIERGIADLRKDLGRIQGTYKPVAESETMDRRLAALENHSQSISKSLRDIQQSMGSVALKPSSVPSVSPVELSYRNEVLPLRKDLDEQRIQLQETANALQSEMSALKKQIELRAESTILKQNRDSSSAETLEAEDCLRQDQDDPAGYDRFPSWVQSPTSAKPQVVSPSTDWLSANNIGNGSNSSGEDGTNFGEDLALRDDKGDSIETSEISKQVFAGYTAQDIYARFKQQFADADASNGLGVAEEDTYTEDSTSAASQEDNPFGVPNAFELSQFDNPAAPSEELQQEPAAFGGNDVELDLDPQEPMAFRGLDKNDDSSGLPSHDSRNGFDAFLENSTDSSMADEQAEFGQEEIPPDTDEETFEPKTEQAHSSPTEFDTPDVTKSDHGDEDSIESYMEQLLRRVRGDTTIISPTQPLNAKKNSSQASDDGRKKLHEYPEPDPNKVPSLIPDDAVEREPYRSRQVAPEKLPDMDAMRELANSTARLAINHSQRKRMLTIMYSKIAVSVIGFMSAVFLYSLNGFQMNFALIGMAAAIIVGFWYGWEGAQESMKLRNAQGRASK